MSLAHRASSGLIPLLVVAAFAHGSKRLQEHSILFLPFLELFLVFGYIFFDFLDFVFGALDLQAAFLVLFF